MANDLEIHFNDFKFNYGVSGLQAKKFMYQTTSLYLLTLYAIQATMPGQNREVSTGPFRYAGPTALHSRYPRFQAHAVQGPKAAIKNFLLVFVPLHIPGKQGNRWIYSTNARLYKFLNFCCY